MAADTLIRCLETRARERPDALYSRYVFPDRDAVAVTFRETLNRTREFAALYARRRVERGDVVLAVLDHHEDLMPAYLGAMWLGAVPAFLPGLTAKLDPEHYHRNMKTLLETTQPRAIMTDPELRAILERTLPLAGRPVLLGRDEASPDDAAPEAAEIAPEDVALIQYSSGSTGLQKGAALSHRAVSAEIRGVGEFFELTEEDAFVTWVPLYHDWGLVCVALHALQLGVQFTLLSPLHWVSRPVAAFEAIDRYRPSVYYQPNFAFNFMASRVRDEEMKGLDLSSLRICCNGAEPCFYDSHEMFARRFARWGFRRESLSIVYGMAEVTNSVFAAGHREPIEVDLIDREVLKAEHRAQPVAEDSPDVQRMLGVGRPLRGTEYEILDDDRRALPERHVGEIAIRSEARYHGYYRNPEATAAADHEGWYLTGDLGYRRGRILFVTGRKSDLIIAGGVNIYPHDVENIVAEHPAVVKGRVAAIGVDSPELGTQQLYVVAESRSTDPEALNSIAEHTRREVALRLGVAVDRVYHAPYRWLQKTSSGKIARLPTYHRLHELETHPAPSP